MFPSLRIVFTFVLGLVIFITFATYDVIFKNQNRRRFISFEDTFGLTPNLQINTAKIVNLADSILSQDEELAILVNEGIIKDIPVQLHKFLTSPTCELSVSLSEIELVTRELLERCKRINDENCAYRMKVRREHMEKFKSGDILRVDKVENSGDLIANIPKKKTVKIETDRNETRKFAIDSATNEFYCINKVQTWTLLR